MKRLLGLVCFLILTGACRGEKILENRAARIDEMCVRFMEKEQVPGLGVAVGLANEVVYEKGYGLADVENKVPATVKTRYRTASIAKSITAVMALDLMEDGKLDLDAPVQRYVPEFPLKPWPINSRQLLAHLSGIRHYARPGEAAGKQHFNSLRGALEIFAEDFLLHEPDTKFLYTSYGYNLLGAVVESAGGEKFGALLERIVTKPAGMESTCIDEQSRIIPDRARGYALRRALDMKALRRSSAKSAGATAPDYTDSGVREGVLINCELHDTSMKIPGGGLLSTPADLVRFMQAVNSGKLLKPETVKQMWTRQRTKDGKQIPCGLGWFVSADDARVRSVSHSGGQAGTTTLMMLQPDTGRAVAVMCNLEKAPIRALIESILEELGKVQ